MKFIYLATSTVSLFAILSFFEVSLTYVQEIVALTGSFCHILFPFTKFIHLLPNLQWLTSGDESHQKNNDRFHWKQVKFARI